MEQSETDRNAEEIREPSAGKSGETQPSDAEPTHAETAQDHGVLLPGKSVARRPAHYELDIQFEDRAEDPELGRLVESTVWVNRSHPAYRRALASRSIGYHIALAVTIALAPLAVESANERWVVMAFLFSLCDELVHSNARYTYR